MKALAILVVVSATAAASPLPKGFAVVPTSASPDGKLAVIAPDTRTPPTKDSHDNKLIEVATGKVIATLVSPTAPIHDSEVDFEPRWSADGSLLEWYVDGKWGSYALVLVRVEHGAVISQIDVRELAVHEVLAEVQARAPGCGCRGQARGRAGRLVVPRRARDRRQACRHFRNERRPHDPAAHQAAARVRRHVHVEPQGAR